ncbi:response regulator [Pseudokineococcus sp. 5B2Z-1]|uniref:response regulator n=1 Tax=Pseudokineococcus sp. 5B2Z-1 TaxID=3132744 RepID=UPI0030DB6C5A
MTAAGGGPPAPVRVVVVDDHAALRGGVRAALEADGFTVVAEGATARRAVELAVEHEPDVLLLDVHMPGSGVAAAQEVSRRLPGTAVVMLTASQDEEDLLGSLRAGARGFLLKDMDPARLGAALRGVLAGEAALPRALVARVLEELRAAPAPGGPCSPGAGPRPASPSARRRSWCCCATASRPTRSPRSCS